MRHNRFSLFVIFLTVISLTVAVTHTVAAQTVQVMNIGVLGSFDSPTARGASLAISQLNAAGPLTLPDGSTYTLAVLAAEAQNSAEVQSAIAGLKQNKVVALFGPDDEILAAQSAGILSGAGVPVFTAATNTSLKTGGAIYRTQSPDNVRMSALADVLTNDLKKTKIAVYQGSPDYSAQASEFVIALAQRRITPTTTVLQVTNTPVTDSIKVMLDTLPDSIVAFGDPAQIAELYKTLRTSQFSNTFVTPNADNRDFIKDIPAPLRSGIYGVTGWSYATAVKSSVDFTRGYVTLFDDAPSSLSAAAFDGVMNLVAAIKVGGIDPQAIQTNLAKLPPTDSIQGTSDPTLPNNVLTNNVAITVTGTYGASTIVVRFNGANRLPPDTTTPATNAAPTLIPSPTLLPSATLVPTLSLTSTPQGVIGIVTGAGLNIRSGPGLNYDKLGQLARNDQIQLFGANADFTWYVFIYRGQQGWVSASLLKVSGDLKTLLLIAPPPTPTPPPATATPTPQPFADLVMISATLNPPIPQPGTPFTLSVVVRNQGAADAPSFAVATSFKPGDVYSAVNLPGVAAGQEITANLTATVTGTTYDTITVVLDLNNQVNEGPNGKANNRPTFTYKVDRPMAAHGSSTMNPGQEVNLDGGGNDFKFTGSAINPESNTALAVVSSQVAQIHRDLVASVVSPVPNNANVINGAAPGTVIGFRTPGGRFGYIHVNGYSGGGPSLNFDYVVYQ